jgi:hypothetical protein
MSILTVSTRESPHSFKGEKRICVGNKGAIYLQPSVSSTESPRFARRERTKQ